MIELITFILVFLIGAIVGAQNYEIILPIIYWIRKQVYKNTQG